MVVAAWLVPYWTASPLVWGSSTGPSEFIFFFVLSTIRRFACAREGPGVRAGGSLAYFVNKSVKQKIRFVGRDASYAPNKDRSYWRPIGQCPSACVVKGGRRRVRKFSLKRADEEESRPKRKEE